MLKIESACAILTSPGRNFVILKIETKDGRGLDSIGVFALPLTR